MVEEKIYSVEKEIKGVKFTVLIKVWGVDEHGYFSLLWKVPGLAENKVSSDDGWYGNAKIENGVLKFYRHTFSFGQVDGFTLPDEVAKQIETVKTNAIAAWETKKGELVAKIVSGEIKLDVGVVGCDFVQYQPWVSDGFARGEYNAQNLMSDAITALLKRAEVDTYFGNPCDLLSSGLRVHNICLTEELPAYASEPILFEAGNKYGFKPGYVSSFKASMADMLAPVIERRKVEAEKEKTAKVVEDNELMIFGDALLSSAGCRRLHSLAATIKKDGITLFSPANARLVPGAKTTYDIREELKAAGYKFDGQEKSWKIEHSKENINKTIELLKKHDRKASPAALGLAQCWECGCWVKASRLDKSGYCGC